MDELATIKISRAQNGFKIDISIPREGWKRHFSPDIEKTWVARTTEDLSLVLDQAVLTVTSAIRVRS